MAALVENTPAPELADLLTDRPPAPEPRYGSCPGCAGRVLVVAVKGREVMADTFEWEPRAACPYCGHVEGRGHTRGQCPRCDSSGYVGEQRPARRVLAIDVAWSDEGGVRIIGPGTVRRRGEGLYPLHSCEALDVRR